MGLKEPENGKYGGGGYIYIYRYRTAQQRSVLRDEHVRYFCLFRYFRFFAIGLRPTDFFVQVDNKKNFRLHGGHSLKSFRLPIMIVCVCMCIYIYVYIYTHTLCENILVDVHINTYI